MVDKQQVLNRLNIGSFYQHFIPSLKVNGKPEVLGLCPFHKDHNPSLSINLKKGLYRCFACGAKGDVFEFYQRLHNVNFQESLDRIGVEFCMADKSKVVATFEYKDSAGDALYIKQRIEPGRNGRRKEFVFKHRENDKWVKGRGCDPALYNLPKVVDSRCIIVVEGEAKSDLLNSWGLVATCLDSGANSPWREEYIKFFSGKRVVILPDNDNPGRLYANKIASSLYGAAETLRVVGLPGLGEAEDVIDWAKMPGNDKAKLLSLVKDSPLWTPMPMPSQGQSSETEECDEATIEETINNMSKKTQNDEIRKILTRIASDTYSFEQTKHIRDLARKTGHTVSDLKRAVGEITENQRRETADSDITIAHPGYEVNQDFMSLGFRETIISGDHTEDRNLYLVSNDGKYELSHDTIAERETGILLFDVRDRVLVNINEKWSRLRMLEFIKNPTSPVGLYQEIKQTLKQYVELGSDGRYGLLTSWIMATYFHRCFNAVPFVFLYGKKGCGKTRGLDLLERLAFNAYKTKGVSVASLGDSIDATRSTFLNDQAESLSDPKNVEILGILTDSYTSGGGKRRVVVISNKNRKVVEFETYSPKAFASIKEIDSDLKDRCILFPMIRASKEYPYPEAHLPVWGELRDKLYRLLLVRWKDAKEIYQTTGEGVTHRVKELWKPLETMLRLEDVPFEEQKEVMSVFLESMQETQVELSDHETKLFETLLEMLEGLGQGVFSVGEIADKIEHDEGISGKALQTWIGNTLKQMGIYTSPMGRKNKKRAYLFSSDRVRDIFDRYTLKTGGTGGQVVSAQQNQGIQGDHLKNRGGIEVVSGIDNNKADVPP
ncbi:partial DNA primase, partial [Candidatus Brocadiaceae bacterium]